MDQRPADWKVIADRLEAEYAAPTSEQVKVAAQLGVVLPTVPAEVAAALLRQELSVALFLKNSEWAEELEWLNTLEAELALPLTSNLITGTKAERSARIAAIYGLKTARELGVLMPVPGDILRSIPPEPTFEREVSSLGRNGRIYFRGVPPKSSWPGHVEVVARLGSDDYPQARNRIESAQLNTPGRLGPNQAVLDQLAEFEVNERIPSTDAIRQFEQLLATERGERPFQLLIEQNPSLLAVTVIGSWRTFVIPQSRLGAEFVTDFLVLGVNSSGMQWVLVEIEAPSHTLHIQDGSLAAPVRHALGQIHTWREWLTENVGYAQRPRSLQGLGLHGMTNRAPGLVIIGRADPTTERDTARLREDEFGAIEVHSYDWLLRHAQGLASSGLRATDSAWNLQD